MGINSFELTSELLEQIIFAMENQKEKFMLDPLVPSIVPKDVGHNLEGVSYELPLWEPSDGYRLMEQFVLSLRNPVYREHLSSILHCGSGVFRKYKDALNQRPDIERLWFAFKEKEMKNRVSEWYNALRLEWGLDAYEVEFNGEYSPVLTDFSIIPGRTSHLEQINAFDIEAYRELYASYPEDYISDLIRRSRDGFEPEISSDSTILIAESPNEEIVGFIWITTEVLENGTHLGRIRQIYILPEYRGLGLAEKLKESVLESDSLQTCDIVEIDIPEKADFLKNDLQQQGFVCVNSLLIRGGDSS
ncbi:MAG: GNAT family N-acetyltransferase [Spirochaetaceae bacterium]|nr:GNAT family N-acetyltransferase [Spirochaetaceae bacterium]